MEHEPRSANVTVRHARKEDIETVSALICSLASYANLLHHVQATPSALASTLCLDENDPSAPPAVPSPSRPARCLLLSADDKIVGFAVYYFTYSTWLAKPGGFLEDLFVQEGERGKGFGRRLMAEVARAVIEIGGCRLDWNVLKWNETAIRFYQSLDVQTIDLSEWSRMRLEGEELTRLCETPRVQCAQQ